MYNRVILGLADRNGVPVERDLVKGLISKSYFFRFGKGVFEGRPEPSIWLEGNFEPDEIIGFLQETDQICALAQRNGQAWIFIDEEGKRSYAGVLVQTEGKPDGDHSFFDGRYYVLVS